MRARISKNLLSQSRVREKGFGLIEAMLGCLILGITLIAIATIHAEYMKRQAIYLKRMVGQNLLASFVSDVQTQGKLLPMLVRNGEPVTYVFCYGKDGMPRPNDAGELGARVVTTELSTKMPSTICRKQGEITALGYELHMNRELATPDYASLHVIGLMNGRADRPGEDVAYTVRVFIPQGN